MGVGSSVLLLFVDEQMMVSKHRYLCQMGNTDYLSITGHFLELESDLLCCLAADTGIDLVEDCCSNLVFFGKYILNREHDTRKLTA